MGKSFQVNMTEGGIMKKLIIYSLPLIASNILQLLFNAADIAVVGRFADKLALAAVGSTGALINLIIGLFVGLSVGANVVIAKCVGENNEEKAQNVVGVSIVISIIFGILLAIIGFIFANTFLRWMNCDKEVIDLATLYMKIYFLGMPVVMLYNYASSILRAVGDTVRPLIYLICGGVINVLLNIIFVTVFDMTVDGVALATVISQAFSAIATLITLRKSKGFCHLDYNRLKIFKTEFIEMLKIGLPAGIQGCFFSISNVIIQSSINSFNADVIAGNTIASNIDGFLYNAMVAVSLSSLAFVSQNLGAGKIDRIKKVVWSSALLVFIIGFSLGLISILFAEPLIKIYNRDPSVVLVAKERLIFLSSTYFLCGIMDVFSNSLRGLGRSTTAMVVTLTGSCLLRIVWIATVFKLKRELMIIYIIYPISWFVTACVHIALYLITIKQKEKQLDNLIIENSQS